MAKVQSFGDKVAKAHAKKTECPVCGQVVTYVKVVAPTQTEAGNFRFRSRMQRLCKCTEAELAGK